MASSPHTDELPLQDASSIELETSPCSSLHDTSCNDDEDRKPLLNGTNDFLEGEPGIQDKQAPEIDSAKYHKAVLSAYTDLSSRRVDLVGDYVGNELFSIDGDSLLLQRLSEGKLDLENGLQLLHAVFVVKNFLSHLQRRKCCFKLVFFDANRRLCIPPGATVTNHGRYLLARAVIVRHLQIHLPRTQPGLTLSVFLDYQSPSFLEFLHEESPYFLMPHGSTRDLTRDGQRTDEDNRVAFRQMVLSFIQRGFNVGLINELEWRDRKVITVILESKQRDIGFGIHRIPAISKSPQAAGSSIWSQVEFIKQETPALSKRQMLLVLTVGRILTTHTNLLDSGLEDSYLKLLLHQALMVQLPISSRRVTNSVHDKSAQFLTCVADIATDILADPEWAGDQTTPDGLCDICDFIDGRLYNELL